MVRTSPSKAEGRGAIPGLGAKIPHASRPNTKTKNESSIVTNSIKILKMVHIKKSFKKNTCKYFGAGKHKTHKMHAPFLT